MTNETPEMVQHSRALIRSVVEGKRCILCMGVVAGMKSIAEELLELGASACFLVAASLGTGELPDHEDIVWHVIVDETADTIMESIRGYEHALHNPPVECIEALEKFDPDHEAIVFGAHTSDIEDFLGRRRVGARLPEWAAYEDKVVIDELRDSTGVTRAPSKVVGAADTEAARLASRAFDVGAGVVWAGDSREGYNGGATYTRWIRDDEDAVAAHAFFAEHCDRIRVMPFLEGIPCSIHGIVFDNYVAVFRPFEMVVFRRPEESSFVYSGFANYWDPSDANREEMREAARRVGRELRARSAYRGAFTIDGVMTRDGFVPTELNARTGGAFGRLASGAPELGFVLLETLIRDGQEMDFRPRELEAFVLKLADEKRSGGGWMVVKKNFEQTETHRLVFDGEGFQLADENEDEDATLTIGPSDMGGFVRFSPGEGLAQVGDSIAPLVADAFNFADETFDLGVGPIVPAVDVGS